MHERSLALRRQGLADGPATKESWCDLGGSLNNFAMRLRDGGAGAEAVVLLRQAVEAQHEALRVDPVYERSRWFLRNHLMNLAQAERRMDDAAAAIESYREAIRIGEGLVGDFPELVMHQNNLALDLNALATLELEAGQMAEALRHKERMLFLVEVLAKGVGENLPGPKDLANLQQDLARLCALGPDPESRNPARAVELAKAAVENDPTHPTAWHALGLAHCMAGSPEEAIAAVEKSIELTGTGDALNWFVRCMARWQLGDQDGARSDYNLALEWLRSDLSKPYRGIAEPYQVEASKRLKPGNR